MDALVKAHGLVLWYDKDMAQKVEKGHDDQFLPYVSIHVAYTPVQKKSAANATDDAMEENIIIAFFPEEQADHAQVRAEILELFEELEHGTQYRYQTTEE